MSMAVGPGDGVAWVTGASTGIGRAVACALADAGWRVAATARSADKLAALAAERPGILPVPGDVTDAAAVRAMVDRLTREEGGVALAILNAGTYVRDRAEDLDPAEFARTIELNLLATVDCVAALMPGWLARRRGQLAIVSSVAGYRGLPGALSYGSSKAALINFTESLRFDFDRLGLKVQVINPGFVRTPLTDKNDFPMPFIIEADDAARRILDGLARDRFEIAFPRRFVQILKRLRCLPYGLYFALVGRQTGARHGRS